MAQGTNCNRDNRLGARRHLKFYEPADFPSKVTSAAEQLYTSPLEASILNFLRESYDKKS